jgi:hypothetical protein
MKKATAAQPWLANAPFAPPQEGIATVTIDANTGLLAAAECTEVIQERYLSGTEPKESCSVAAHDWLLNLRQAPTDISQQPLIEEPGKSAPLIPPPKQPNAFKRFFSKIF